jgi:hypothetical protein
MEDNTPLELTNRASPFELPEEDDRPGSPIPVYRSASSMSDESPEISTFEPIFREVDGDLELNEAWMFCTPRLPRVAILRHPRVLLAFLRFVELQNEVALEGEAIILPAIPSEIVRKIMNHPSITNPPIEFIVDIEELKDRIEALIH